MPSKIPIKRTALLIIDITNVCCHEKCELPERGITYKRIRKMVPKLKEFIRIYKKTGGKVIYVNCVEWQKEFLPDNLNELYKDPDCTYYTEDKSTLGT
ncbi:MAG: cysteine hydrolase [Nanoarchaeota archaeon]|nr:cysteine hydrolase [Nanoarchaeota archaeon]